MIPLASSISSRHQFGGLGFGQSEPGNERLVADAGDVRDLLVAKGEHEQTACPEDQGVGVGDVIGDGGLAVRPGGDQPERCSPRAEPLDERSDVLWSAELDRLVNDLISPLEGTVRIRNDALEDTAEVVNTEP
jgi:hypothetical protein